MYLLLFVCFFLMCISRMEQLKQIIFYWSLICCLVLVFNENGRGALAENIYMKDMAWKQVLFKPPNCMTETYIFSIIPSFHGICMNMDETDMAQKSCCDKFETCFPDFNEDEKMGRKVDDTLRTNKIK